MYSPKLNINMNADNKYISYDINIYGGKAKLLYMIFMTMIAKQSMSSCNLIKPIYMLAELLFFIIPINIITQQRHVYMNIIDMLA